MARKKSVKKASLSDTVETTENTVSDGNIDTEKTVKVYCPQLKGKKTTFAGGVVEFDKDGMASVKGDVAKHLYDNSYLFEIEGYEETTGNATE